MQTCFDCDRTCPRFERVDLCRFQPLFAALGPNVVTSHTTTVQTEYRDHAALAEAVQKLGGAVIGQGQHHIGFGNQSEGLGFTLPGWYYTLCATKAGALQFDSMSRRGGIQVAELTREYIYAVTRKAAGSNRWTIVSDTPAGIVLRHPNGGKLTVKPDGTCDASGFKGAECHATEQIEQAIGTRGSRRYKPEYGMHGNVRKAAR